MMVNKAGQRRDWATVGKPVAERRESLSILPSIRLAACVAPAFLMCGGQGFTSPQAFALRAEGVAIPVAFQWRSTTHFSLRYVLSECGFVRMQAVDNVICEPDTPAVFVREVIHRTMWIFSAPDGGLQARVAATVPLKRQVHARRRG